MKKALSLVLCLLMVFGSFSGIITASAEVTGKNLWTDISVDDFGTKDTKDRPISEFAEGKNNYGKNFTVKGAYHTSFYIEMPELEENSTYNLSFKYDNHIIEKNPGKINNINIVTEEEMAQITDVDGIKLPSTATTIGSALELDKGDYTDLSATFTTGATKTKHYLYFRTGFAYWFFLCDFKLVKVPTYNVAVEGGTADKVIAKEGDTVTLTATPTLAQKFESWEVVSGNVALSDATDETATFTMPAEDVEIKAVYTENLWGAIDTTWFGTLITSPRDGFGFTDYKDSTGTFADAKAVNKCWHTTFYIKLPSNLKTNTEYEFSFNYDNSIQTTASQIKRIDIVFILLLLF